MRKGINAQRRILNPSHGIQEELYDLQTTGFPGILFRAVIVDVLTDPTKRDDYISKYGDVIDNLSFLEDHPRNSVIARIVTNGQDRKGTRPILCYPLFPPYMSMPVKPGEQVWVIFENPTLPSSLGYWIGRTHEPDTFDDVNYTHADRKFDDSTILSTSEKLSAGTTTKKPGFINGGGTEESQTLSGADDYETIVEEAIASNDLTYESVPRFTKRPGDQVLQGSNNTLIVLGEDRVGESTKTESNKKLGAGTIDIVVGRGRFQPGSSDEEPKDTAARVIINDRGFTETDKNPSVNNKKGNDAEGDPDFVNDSSRMYASMRTDGDKNFSVSANLPVPHDGSYDDIDDSPYEIFKTDNIRIIARKNDAKGINGTIRIIKEGGDDKAGILIDEDGRVHVYGSRIFVGHAGGAGPGPGGSEPFTKFSVRQTWLENVIDTINAMLTTLATNFNAPANASPGYGAPNPGLLNSIASIESTKAQLEILKSQIPDAKSARIFGE